MASLTQMPMPNHIFELDPAFYYLKTEQRKILDGKDLPVLNYYELTNF